ncbi:MAG: hypothetical protein EP340_03390 [Alphaproteobacteria bacterium]|nr:MAG: hypothetical protein EP340_03390 [Alphaproteobacteria bacterium]
MGFLNLVGTVLLGYIVYRFFRSLMGGDEQKLKMEEAVRQYRMRQQQKAGAKQAQAQAQPEAMKQCAVCEAYVPESSATACGREDCPLRNAA